MQRLSDILVPKPLLKSPKAFGGDDAGDCLRGDLILKDGRAVGLEVGALGNAPRMLIPALSEPHCHLDKCHSIGRIGNVGGDLAHALAAQRHDKELWTAEDLRSRMAKGLSELVAAGCRHVRSHIDWGDDVAAPVGWSVLTELAGDYPLLVQSAALTGVDQMANRDICFGIAGEIAAAPNGVLGSFLLYHDHMREGLRNIFAAAERFGLPLDFHVDEGLGAYNALELICDVAVETAFDGPILCGHAVSLVDRESDDLARIIDKLLQAGVAVCALPTTNLYLQGRRAGTPDRRGITRLRELRAAGVPVLAGSDNVADAFCPMGQHDPRAALHLAALAAHLDPPMGQWLTAITTDAAEAMGLADGFIEHCPTDELRLCAAPSTADLVAGRAPLIPISQATENYPQ